MSASWTRRSDTHSFCSPTHWWPGLQHLQRAAWWWFSRSVVSHFCDLVGRSLPGSSVYGVLQARIQERLPLRGSSQPRDRATVSCFAGWSSTTQPPGKLWFLHLLSRGRAGTWRKVCLATWIFNDSQMPQSLVWLKRSKWQKMCLNKCPLQAFSPATRISPPRGVHWEHSTHKQNPAAALSTRASRDAQAEPGPLQPRSPAPGQEGAHGVAPLAQPGCRRHRPKSRLLTSPGRGPSRRDLWALLLDTSGLT